jgi:hypothetical protein
MNKRAEDAFLALMARFESEGRNLSHQPKANNAAPKLFVGEREATGLRKKDLEEAMRRPHAGTWT